MSTVPPPPSLPSTPPPQATVPTVTVRDAPPAVQTLPPGSTVEAKVVAALERGTVQVDTRFGPLSLKTALPLKEGGEMSLQVLSTTRGQTLLKIATLNGRPIGLGAPNPAAAGTTGALAAQIPSGLGATNLSGGFGTQTTSNALGTPVSVSSSAQNPTGGITALVVKGAGQAGNISGQPGNAASGAGQVGANPQGTGGSGAATLLPTGTQLTVRIASITPPGQAGTVAAPASAATTPSALAQTTNPGQSATAGQTSPGQSGQTPNATTGTASGSGPLSGSATGNAQAATQASSITPTPSTAGANRPGFIAGAQTGANAPSTAAQGTLAGVVQSSGGGGAQPLVQTDAGLLALRTRLDALPGARLSLQVVASNPPGTPPPTVTASPTPLVGGAGWPALSEGLDVLARVDPAAGAGLRAAIPQPGAGLGAAMTSFVQAVRPGGDVQKWPGDAHLKALEKSGRKGADLAGRISQDMSDMAGRVAEQSGEWRSMPIPFLNGQEIDAITMVMRSQYHGPEAEAEKDKQDADGKNANQEQRFLIDLDLSRLGPLQLDGSYHRGDRVLNMTLRSASPLTPKMRQDIRLLFSDALRHMALVGELRYEVTRAFVRPSVGNALKSQTGLGSGPGAALGLDGVVV